MVLKWFWFCILSSGRQQRACRATRLQHDQVPNVALLPCYIKSNLIRSILVRHGSSTTFETGPKRVDSRSFWLLYRRPYEQPPSFLRDSKASKTRARVKITPRLSPFSRGVIFTRASIRLLSVSLRENGDYSQSTLSLR